MNSESTALQTRRYDLDWLRIFAILTVFLFHSTAFFQLEDWHVKNQTTYFWIQYWWVGFTTRWMMPLFFFISGASIFCAMNKAQGWWQFYIDKSLRLLVPLVFGSLTHISLQIYLERVSHGQFYGSFFEFFPFYFVGPYTEIGDISGNYNVAGDHLWYLWLLFHYCLIFYPLFNWFKKGGCGFLGKITHILNLPGLIYILLPLPHLLMATVIPQSVLTFGAGGWGFLQYIFFLIGGFVVISSEALQNRIYRQRWISIALGITGLIGLVAFQPISVYLSHLPPVVFYYYHITNLLCSWSLLLAMIGFGKRYLTFTNAFNQFANEAVLPFYIMHQTVLVCIGYFVVRYNIHDFFKWGIIVTFSFFICLCLYDFVIRKIDLLRLLFGMKTKAFQVMRRPVPQVLIVLLFITPAIIAQATQYRSKAIFSDSTLPRVIYSYKGNPAFSFSYPAKSSDAKTKEFSSQVLSLETPFGKIFAASVSSLPSGIPLSDFGPKVLLSILAKKGSQHQVLKNEPFTLNDGTAGYKTVFSRLENDGTRHTIISVAAYKNDKCVTVVVDTWEDPGEVEWIVESLVLSKSVQ